VDDCFTERRSERIAQFLAVVRVHLAAPCQLALQSGPCIRIGTYELVAYRPYDWRVRELVLVRVRAGKDQCWAPSERNRVLRGDAEVGDDESRVRNDVTIRREVGLAEAHLLLVYNVEHHISVELRKKRARWDQPARCPACGVVAVADEVAGVPPIIWYAVLLGLQVEKELHGNDEEARVAQRGECVA